MTATLDDIHNLVATIADLPDDDRSDFKQRLLNVPSDASELRRLSDALVKVLDRLENGADVKSAAGPLIWFLSFNPGRGRTLLDAGRLRLRR